MATREQKDELEMLLGRAKQNLSDLVVQKGSRQHEAARLRRFIKQELESKAEAFCKLSDGTQLATQRDGIIKGVNQLSTAVSTAENSPDEVAALISKLFEAIDSAIGAVDLEPSAHIATPTTGTVHAEGNVAAVSAEIAVDGVVHRAPESLVKVFVANGCEELGDVVVAKTEAAIQHFEKGKKELRELLPRLRQMDPKVHDLASLQFRVVVAELSGIAGMLEEGALHLGIAVDSRNLLQKLTEHPEYAALAGLALQAIGLILVL